MEKINVIWTEGRYSRGYYCTIVGADGRGVWGVKSKNPESPEEAASLLLEQANIFRISDPLTVAGAEIPPEIRNIIIFWRERAAKLESLGREYLHVADRDGYICAICHGTGVEETEGGWHSVGGTGSSSFSPCDACQHSGFVATPPNVWAHKGSRTSSSTSRGEAWLEWENDSLPILGRGHACFLVDGSDYRRYPDPRLPAESPRQHEIGLQIVAIFFPVEKQEGEIK